MPRTKQTKQTIIETEESGASEIEQNCKPAADGEIEEGQEEEIRRLIGSLGPETRVYIYKADHAGKSFLTNCEPSFWSEQWLQQSYGEGTYYIQLRNHKGIRAGRTIRIGPLPAGEKPTQIVAPTVIPPIQANAQFDFRTQLLIDELSAQRQMILKMIERPVERTSMAELVEAMTALKAMTPASPAAATGMEAIMSILKTGIEIGATGNVEMKKDGILSTIKEALPILGEVVKTVFAKSNAENPQGGTAAQLPAAGEDRSLAMLRHGVSYLKQKALQGKRPDVYIDFILENLDDPQWQPFLRMCQGPFEEIAKIDPELLNAPFRPWFEQLWNELKAAINQTPGEQANGTIENTNAGGPAGD